jgi:YidC/Oxa1 family membrane protein insertase
MPTPFDADHKRRLFLAVGLSAAILLAFDLGSQFVFGRHLLSPAPQVTAPASTPAAAEAPAPSAAAPAIRLPLGGARFAAELNLTGGRLDTLTLNNYAEKIGEATGFALLHPTGPNAEYIESGWQGAGLEGPGPSSIWQPEADVNAPGKPLVLTWRNSTGQSFQRTLTPSPDGYTITVTEQVVNGAALPVSFNPYVQIHRADGYAPNEKSNFVNYFGPMGVSGVRADGTETEAFRLHETSYADLAKRGQSDAVTASGGWWGMTGQYFMTAVVPGENVATTRSFAHTTQAGRSLFSASVQWPAVVVPVGGSASIAYTIYAGPKQDTVLAATGHGLERAVDWGWFRAIARPFYLVLEWLYGHVGNWGIAIVILTFLLKLATFPLANTSYRAMAKMKKLQPKLEALKAKHGSDQQAMGLAMMELYKTEKVNPLSGCWPMLVQIPIFFAMYKVVLVAFEFRHAPLALWVHDMSAMDPLYVLPLLMGASMWLQMRLSPPAADPVQAKVFQWMPVIFTVMFLWFPAGLVFYWLVNNLFSIAQQYYMLRRENAL